jgi:hypothetical protein
MSRAVFAVARSLAIAAAMVVVVSAPAVAAPDNDHACSPYGQAINFTLALDSSIRTPGTHAYEFSSAWSGGGDDIAYAVTFDPAAPVYPGTAYLRPGWMLVQGLDGHATDQISRLNPAQDARYQITWYLDHGDTMFASSISVSVRWETSPLVWSSWVVIPKGATTSPCAPGGVAHWGGLFHEAWGWAK